MTVQKLMSLLMLLNPDRQVVLAKDEEGNGYSTLCEVEKCMFSPGNAEIYGPNDTDKPKDVVPAVVLWPVG